MISLYVMDKFHGHGKGGGKEYNPTFLILYVCVCMCTESGQHGNKIKITL